MLLSISYVSSLILIPTIPAIKNLQKIPLIDIDKKTGDLLEKQPSNKERDKNYVKTSPNLQHIENLYFDAQVSKV
jgi:hypothetical protein